MPEAVIREDFVSWLKQAFSGHSTAEEAERHLSPHDVAMHGVDKLLEIIAAAAAGREPSTVRQGPIPGTLLATFEPEREPAHVLFCYVDDAGRLFGVAPAPPGVEIVVVPSASLTPTERSAVHALFELTYDEANNEYLDRSLGNLSTIANARSDGMLVGFSLGDQRVLDLPHAGPTTVLLAGLACVHPDHRRHGLFRHLANLSLRAVGNPTAEERTLGAGRMAHPASMRGFAASPTVVPRPDHHPSEVQRSIGSAVAAAYGVSSFDPDTFVCRGTGRPIGFPRMIQEVEPHEWKVFDPVDRSRGDALLALVWHGDPPPGW